MDSTEEVIFQVTVTTKRWLWMKKTMTKCIKRTAPVVLYAFSTHKTANEKTLVIVKTLNTNDFNEGRYNNALEEKVFFEDITFNCIESVTVELQTKKGDFIYL